MDDTRMHIADQVYEQAKRPPEPLAQEVLDFALFLRARRERGEWRDLMHPQSVVLSGVWDDPEDEAWNNVWRRGPRRVSIPLQMRQAQTPVRC